MGGRRGGQKRGRTQRKHFRENRENVWKKSRSDKPSSDNNNDGNNPSWQPFATQNLGFEEYYKEQRIVPEEEWVEFLQVLRKPLPAAFRINSSGQFFQDIRSQLENDFMKSLEAEVTNGDEPQAIRPLPWYPNNLAWHLNFSRMQLRKNQTLERFHEFLKLENEIGNITRQEAVSMVPPLFLDVHPDQCVLDMCAAPGSKTFQLLEIIHQSTKPGSLPNGLVIANDVDVQRCNLLIHQTKRMCSANLIVTNHEAQHFPSCRLNDKCLETSEMGSMGNGLPGSPGSGVEPGKKELLFDRVLCDVPCSGDGTLRKAPDIWRKWNAGMGNGLHCLQVLIAMRGIALLEVGGRMVYSTCSMNPVENEAVVAEVLQRSGGSVELLDVSGELPQLVRHPGLTKWKVRDKGIWFSSYKDLPENRRGAIVRSMFPSGQSCKAEETSDSVIEDVSELDNVSRVESVTSLEEGSQNACNLGPDDGPRHVQNDATPTNIAETGTKLQEPHDENTSPLDLGPGCTEETSIFPLERCMRILPHDQNSGAFFIAVLQKISPLQAVSENLTSRSKLSSHRRHELPEKVPNKVTDDTSMSEISPPTGSLDGHSVQDEETSVAELLHKPTIIPKEVSAKVASTEVSAKDSNSGDAKACDSKEKGVGGEKVEKGRLQVQGKWRGVDPVVLFRDDTTITMIRTFYGITESFPIEGHLVTRNPDVNHVKRIYYISKSVQEVLKLNFQVGQRLKITSLGLKVFERQTKGSSPCLFRISSEGLPLLLPYISKQIASASLVDFEHLLQYRTIKFGDFREATFNEKASELQLGCCVVVLKRENEPTSDAIVVDSSTVAIGCWKGKNSLSVMVSQIDCQELLERLSIRLGRKLGTAAKVNEHEISAPASAEANAMDITAVEDTEGEQALVG